MNICRLCFQDINKHQDFFHWLKQDGLLCGDCLQSLQIVNVHKHINELDVHVLYAYNDFLESMLFQYKEGRDVALASTFFHEQIHYIEKMYKGYTLCLCPSSDEKTKERGFHALETMVKNIHLNKLQPFYKSSDRKQSTLHYDERQTIGDILHLSNSSDLSNKKLLLVDDVCTTGATLKSCYNLIKPHAKEIKALVLCANPLFLQSS